MTAQRPNRGGQPPIDQPNDRARIERVRVRRVQTGSGRRGGQDSGAPETRIDPHVPYLLDDLDEPDTHRVRRGRDMQVIALILGATAFVVVALAKPWGNAGPSEQAQQTAAVEGATAQPAATPQYVWAAGPGLNAPNQDIPCVNDRVDLVTDGEPAPAIALPDIPIARDGRAAYVATVPGPITQAGSRQVVVVADAATVQTVAAVSTPSGVTAGTWAQVRAWTPEGTQLLVAAGRSTPPADEICSNLFLVASDGTSVFQLTDDGPGQVVVGATFITVGGARDVAYLESSYLDSEYGITLMVTNLSGELIWKGPFCRLDNAGILPNDSLLVPSPDGSQVAMLCPDGVQVTDLQSREAKRVLPKASGVRGAVGWSADGKSVFALEDQSQRGIRSLTIVQAVAADAPKGQISHRSTPEIDWEATLGTSSFSRDGTEALAAICAELSSGQCPERFATIDVATGQDRALYDAPAANEAMTSRWLPDGKYVAIGTSDGGSVICAADGSTGPIQTDLPADAAWWIPGR